MKRKLLRFLAATLFTLLAVMNARAESSAMIWFEKAAAEMGDLSTPLTPEGLDRGSNAIARARAIGGTTERECELIDAVAQFYHRHDERTHDMRLVYYERALSRSRKLLPNDLEIAARHADASKAAFARALERVEAYMSAKGASR
jgi:hypothetical protein